MYIKRNLEDTILKFLKSPEIIAIVGPRQSGKTTLINHLIKDLKKAESVSFENQQILRMFEKETEDFIKLYIKDNNYLFIDEFQYAKTGGKVLKYIFDTQKIKIIITGSSAPDLTVRTIKYLVGRVLSFELYPFDFHEFLAAKDKNYLKIYQELRKTVYQPNKRILKIGNEIHKRLLKYYEEYLLFGGYPRVVLEKNQQAKKEILKNIYNTYFLREVKDILGLIDDYKLDKLIKALALQIGNLISYDELTRLSGYSHEYLKKYLNFLEKTYISILAKPFFINKRIEIVKNPKVFFIDSGLRNSIINDFRKLNLRTDKGELLENGIAQQLIKQNLPFNFWRDKKKNEVDFVISLANRKMMAVESKSYLKNNKIKSLKTFKARYPKIAAYISYQDIAKKLDKPEVLPVYLF